MMKSAYANRPLLTISSRNVALSFLVIVVVAAVAPPVAAATIHTGNAVHKIFHWRPFLAPFHAVVLHFPIGFLTVASILEVYRTFRPSDEIRRVIKLILWLGLVSGVIAATFGLMRAGSGEYESHALELHRNLGLSVLVVTVLALIAQKLAERGTKGWIQTYRALLAGAVTLLILAGHQGGNLTHGAKYLVENAPDFLRDLFEDDRTNETENVTFTLNENQLFYAEKVQPILSSKCYSCHGPEKQKGGLRLDIPEAVLKGGESGKPAIKPGDPLESHLVRLILLPPHHDDVMPPQGKKPLTTDEIAVLLEWIRNGAPFPQASARPEGQPPTVASSPNS